MNDEEIRRVAVAQGCLLLSDVHQILNNSYNVSVAVDCIKNILSNPEQNKDSCIGYTLQVGKMKRWVIKEAALEDLAYILRNSYKCRSERVPPKKTEFVNSVLVLSVFYKNDNYANQAHYFLSRLEEDLTSEQAQQLFNVPEKTINTLVDKRILHRNRDGKLEKKMFLGVLSAVKEIESQDGLVGIVKNAGNGIMPTNEERALLNVHKKRIELLYFDIYCNGVV